VVEDDPQQGKREDRANHCVHARREEQPKPAGFPDFLGRSYFAYASFSDPDGNGWLLVASLADLLHETAEHHDAYEKVAPRGGAASSAPAGTRR